MLAVRYLVLLLLGTSIVSFILFAATGEPRYKKFGLTVLKWTLVAAFIFFAVLIVDRWT
jgi:hypothetical protein